MPDQSTIDSVGMKFQEWASSLPAEEQEAVAQWWSARDEVSGYSSNWWQEPNAWQSSWMSWWTE